MLVTIYCYASRQAGRPAQEKQIIAPQILCSHRLHNLADFGDADALSHHCIRYPAPYVGCNCHRDPWQHLIKPRLEQVQPQDLVVVGGHPCQQNEGAPVVAEVTEDEGPDWSLGQQQLPRNFGVFSLQQKAR